MTTLEFLSHLRSLDVKLSADGDRLLCSAPAGVLTPDLRDALSERKADLLALLHPANQVARSASHAPISTVSRDGALPLSFAQERLWALIARTGDSAAYNLPLAFRLTGPLDVKALERSLAEIVHRHETLRTTFSAAGGQPAMRVAPPSVFALPVEDLSGLPVREHEHALRERIRSAAQQPFDLITGPLLRVRLLRLGNDEHVFVLAMHHLISDGWSFDVFFRELATLYEAYCSGRPSPLLDLALQYADYAAWQRERLQDAALAPLLSYWQNRFSGSVPALALPTDRPRDGRHGYTGTRHSLTLSEPLVVQLKTLSAREGATLFMTLLAAFKVLLFRYTGQEDLVVCTPAACRDRDDVKSLIGYFNNLLALRTDLSGHPTFREVVHRVRRVALGAYQHQELPFQKLAGLPGLVRTPLTRGMFTLQQEPARTLELQGVRVRPIPVATGTSNFDVSLTVSARETGLEATMAYKAALFDERTITRMLGDFRALLEAALDRPEEPIASLLPDLASGPSAGRSRHEASALQARAEDRPVVPPRSALEFQLVRLWEETLHTKPIGIRDDFFDLGGHSLLAARLFERIERVLGRRLPLATIFQLSTVEQLARALQDEGWVPPWSSLVAVRPGGSKPPLFGIHSWQGHVLFYRDLARHLDPDQPFYGLQAVGLGGQTPLLASVEDMAAHYVREIKTLQSQGPYRLTGLCFGATIAFEMARRLRAAGESVDALIVLDSGFLGHRAYRQPVPDQQWAQPPEGRLAKRIYDALPLPLARFVGRWVGRYHRVREEPRRVKGKLIRGADKLLHLTRMATSAQYRRFQYVQRINRAIARRYVPEGYPGRITLIYTEGSAVDEGHPRPYLSWKELASEGIDLHGVPGRHRAIMKEPHVRALAARLQACLDEIPTLNPPAP